MGHVSAADGTQLFYKDWGSGPPVLFSHGWPLNADSWEAPMLFLAERGFRCIAHDRRGHGRSGSTWRDSTLDTYADDLAAVIEALDLRQVTLVGFGAGGGEVARYVGRHGTARLARLALVAAVPPLMLQTPDNPGGIRAEVFDAVRRGLLTDRAQLFRDLADGPYFGRNRPGATVSPGTRDAFWLRCMQAGHHHAFTGIAACSATDLRADLDAIDVPTLIVHGGDDQPVPLRVSALTSAARIKDAMLLVYRGAPHGLIDTHPRRLGADLLAFLTTAGARP